MHTFFIYQSGNKNIMLCPHQYYFSAGKVCCCHIHQNHWVNWGPIGCQCPVVAHPQMNVVKQEEWSLLLLLVLQPHLINVMDKRDYCIVWIFFSISSNSAKMDYQIIITCKIYVMRYEKTNCTVVKGFQKILKNYNNFVPTHYGTGKIRTLPRHWRLPKMKIRYWSLNLVPFVFFCFIWKKICNSALLINL